MVGSRNGSGQVDLQAEQVKSRSEIADVTVIPGRYGGACLPVCGSLTSLPQVMMSNENDGSSNGDRPLRFVEFILVPDDEGLHPVDAELAAHPDLTRDHILNINLLPDETVSILYQLRGDIDAARQIFEGNGMVLGYNLSQMNDSMHAYLQLESTESITELLRIPQELDLIPDLPFEYTSQGGLRIRVVGDFEAIRYSGAAVPNSFRLKPERTGLFSPNSQRLFNQLTERQQETLKAAVEQGYYRNPRQATYKDVAEIIDRTDGTVGDHLRKIEEFVMGEIVP